MTTIVERAARAMAEADGEDYMEDYARYDRRARAAIAAMELPTEEMVDRAAERYAGDKAEFENFGAVMNAFADGANFVRAALKEEK